jgi:DsbC/DsbD-like thiol-disulfide interchange protein
LEEDLLPHFVIEEPNRAKPVTVAAAVRPAKVRPGGTLVLYVQARIAPTWHIYGAAGSPSGNAPTTLKLQVPTDMEAGGPWSYPKATEGAEVRYEGTVTFRRHIRVADGAAPGAHALRCEFNYQACDPFSCLPPASLVATASAEVVAND